MEQREPKRYNGTVACEAKERLPYSEAKAFYRTALHADNAEAYSGNVANDVCGIANWSVAAVRDTNDVAEEDYNAAYEEDSGAIGIYQRGR